jgi:hypothetical protein
VALERKRVQMQESLKGGWEMRKRYEVYQDSDKGLPMLVRNRDRITTGIRRGRY